MAGFVSVEYRPDLVRGQLGVVLDHSRWIAAIAVCSQHLRNLLMPDHPPLGILSGFFYIITLIGPPAVVVFFVVSGLLIGGAILRGLRGDKGWLGGYAIDRATRLYIVLIPAVALTISLQATGFTITCAHPEGLAQTLSNLVFLQNFATSPLCNNHPLWSLSSEAFFYMIGPALIIAVAYRSWRAALVTALLVALSVWFVKWNYQTPAFGLILWMIGFAPWFVRVRISPWLAILPFLVALAASRAHRVSYDTVDDLILAATFTLFLCSRFGERRYGAVRLAAALAGFSYSLYLIHMPLAQAITSVLHPPYDPRLPATYLIYAAALSAIVVAAWMFGRVFESRTALVRNWLRARLMRTPGKRGAVVASAQGAP